MNQRDDAALVFGVLRKLMGIDMGSLTEQVVRAFHAAERLHQSRLEGDTEPVGPVVFGLSGDDEVASIRKLAVSRGWFEVPGGAYERLRMIDGASGNHLIVYYGKRGLKAVANVGHEAAQALLREWKKTGRAA